MNQQLSFSDDDQRKVIKEIKSITSASLNSSPLAVTVTHLRRVIISVLNYAVQ
jgi:hypothetical protein